MVWKGPTEIDVHPALEQSPKDPDHFLSFQTQLAGESQSPRYMLRVCHLVRHPLLEEAQLRALRNSMRHRQLDHVIPASQRDHVVEYPRSGCFRIVFEMIFLSFEIFLTLCYCNKGSSGL